MNTANNQMNICLPRKKLNIDELGDELIIEIDNKYKKRKKRKINKRIKRGKR